MLHGILGLLASHLFQGHRVQPRHPEGRSARAGNWVLLEGLDATITKTATLVPEFLDEDVHIIRPLQFHTQVFSLSGSPQ